MIRELIEKRSSRYGLATGRLSFHHLQKHQKETHTTTVECSDCKATWVEDGYISKCFKCGGRNVAQLQIWNGKTRRVRCVDDRPVMELIRWEGLPIPNSMHYSTWRVLREGFEIMLGEGLGTMGWEYTPEEAYLLPQLPARVKSFIEDHLLNRFNHPNYTMEIAQRDLERLRGKPLVFVKEDVL